MAETIKDYIKANESRFFEELFSLLRIPSVSSDLSRKDDMLRCAQRLRELLLEAGADAAEICPTDGAPVVFAEKTVSASVPTVLVYGHYDVQPVEPLELWKSDPFEPEIRDGAIYARGANDDKGQLFMHVKAFEYLCRKGLLNHNVKFLFEGEEEIGSPSLAKWAGQNREKLAASVILVSDTTMISDKVPSINCGMRGLSYVEVKVTGPDKDLHSGHYGGAVANPVNVLCDMVSSLIDKDGKITVKGFYDDVVELSESDRAQLARAPFDLEEYKRFLDIKEVKGEKG
ncbi:MAG: M20/M25/M40 family metallo-hydrolase, partial [Candidatus Cryptobacteroides sp.]